MKRVSIDCAVQAMTLAGGSCCVLGRMRVVKRIFIGRGTAWPSRCRGIFCNGNPLI
jgi:hypothetical protein